MLATVIKSLAKSIYQSKAWQEIGVVLDADLIAFVSYR